MSWRGDREREADTEQWQTDKEIKTREMERKKMGGGVRPVSPMSANHRRK